MVDACGISPLNPPASSRSAGRRLVTTRLCLPLSVVLKSRGRGEPSHLLVSRPSPQQSLALFTSFIDSARLLQSAPFRWSRGFSLPLGPLNSPIGPRGRRRRKRRGEERIAETWAASVLIISTELKTSSGRRRSTRTLRWRSPGSRRSAAPRRCASVGGVVCAFFPQPSPSQLSGVSSNGLHVQLMSACTRQGTFALGGCCCNHQEDLEQHRRPACALWRSALDRIPFTEIWNLT